MNFQLMINIFMMIYGLESFSDIYDIVDTDELIQYIIDNCECFDDLDIQKLLDEYEESED